MLQLKLTIAGDVLVCYISILTTYHNHQIIIPVYPILSSHEVILTPCLSSSLNDAGSFSLLFTFRVVGCNCYDLPSPVPDIAHANIPSPKIAIIMNTI